jgi:very-short-patch-repair endonuclease
MGESQGEGGSYLLKFNLTLPLPLKEGEMRFLSLDGRGKKGEGDFKLDKNLTQIAKKLRKESTHAERLLWRHLKTKQLEGYKFRRQEPIGNYIVDFVCYENRIVIEVDGSQHQTEKAKDKKRDLWLKSQGFKVLRFWNNEVLNNLEGVYKVIKESCL